MKKMIPTANDAIEAMKRQMSDKGYEPSTVTFSAIYLGRKKKKHLFGWNGEVIEFEFKDTKGLKLKKGKMEVITITV